MNRDNVWLRKIWIYYNNLIFDQLRLSHLDYIECISTLKNININMILPNINSMYFIVFLIIGITNYYKRIQLNGCYSISLMLSETSDIVAWTLFLKAIYYDSLLMLFIFYSRYRTSSVHFKT